MQSTQSPVNPRWLAPEILAGARATTASDVFSYGERLLLAMLHNVDVCQGPWLAWAGIGGNCAAPCTYSASLLPPTARGHSVRAADVDGALGRRRLLGGAKFKLKWPKLGCWALLRRAASEKRSVPCGCGFADL